MRMPLRAHIQAVFATRRSGRAVPAAGDADPPMSALTGTGTSDGRGQRPEEDPKVEPQRPVADVVGVARFLTGHIGHRALAHLPHPAEPRTHLVPERAELGAEFRDMVVRE